MFTDWGIREGWWGLQVGVKGARACQVWKETASKFQIGTLVSCWRFQSTLHYPTYAFPLMCKEVHAEMLNTVIRVVFCSPSHAPMVIYPPREGFFFFLIHTKAIHVLAVALNTWIFIVSCLSLYQQCYHLHVRQQSTS